MSGGEFRCPGGSPGGCSIGARRGARAALCAVLVMLCAAGGCGYFTVDDHELDRAIADAEEHLDAGNPDRAIDRLRGVARRRAESVMAREMLVEACLQRDTIETRRYAEKLLRELTELDRKSVV